jgi:hypothetical protein
MPTDSKPALVVSLRNISIPILEKTDKKNGVVYCGYVFSYTEVGQRKQKRCRTPRRPVIGSNPRLGLFRAGPPHFADRRYGNDRDLRRLRVVVGGAGLAELKPLSARSGR